MIFAESQPKILTYLFAANFYRINFKGDNMRLKIDELRKERGMTQIFIARKLEVDRGTVKNWCENKTIPRLDYANEIAKLFNVRLEDIFEE